MSGKNDKYEYLTGEAILPSYQRRLTKQARFTYSPLEKALEKQTKTIEDQGKKEINAIEYHGKQLFESNKVIKNDFNIDRDSIPLDGQKNIYVFNELIGERSYKFHDLEKKVNSNNLIYNYKTEEISPKDFINYQNLIDLFKKLRDGHINPKEVLK